MPGILPWGCDSESGILASVRDDPTSSSSAPGSAGSPSAAGLLGDAVDVTLLDANNFHTFQPLLYQVATAGLDDENVAYAVRGIVRGRGGAGRPT